MRCRLALAVRRVSGLPRMGTESELGIYRSAAIWLEHKGENAVAEAGRLLTEIRRRGDGRSADSWLEIIAALEDLQHRVPTPP